MIRTSQLFAHRLAPSGAQAVLAVMLACGFASTQAAEAPVAAGLQAQSEAASEALEQTPVIADGQASQTWLKAQAERQQASRTRQTLSGPVMSKVHARYLQSFTVPSPARIRDETKTSSSK